MKELDLAKADGIFATPSRAAALRKLMAGNRRARILNLAGSAPAALLTSLPKGEKPYIIIADDLDDAGYIFSDLSHILGEEKVKILPSGYKRDIRFGQPDPPQRILRTDALDAWQREETRWIVTYPEALAEKVPQADTLASSTIRLKVGETARMDDISQRLFDLGFSRADYVYEPGQFAIRGSILDIFSFSAELPYRIDFFGDEIDSIRIFDLETQLSRETVKEAAIIPDTESSGAGEGISFFDFAGEDTHLFCRSEATVAARLKAICDSDMSASALHSGEAETDALKNLVDYSRLEKWIEKLPLVEFGPSFGASPQPDAVMKLDCSPQALYHKNFDIITDSFSDFISKGYKIYILSDNGNQHARLKAIFEERGDSIQFTPVTGVLHEGFIDHRLKN